VSILDSPKASRAKRDNYLRLSLGEVERNKKYAGIFARKYQYDKIGTI